MIMSTKNYNTLKARFVLLSQNIYAIVKNFFTLEQPGTMSCKHLSLSLIFPLLTWLIILQEQSIPHSIYKIIYCRLVAHNVFNNDIYLSKLIIICKYTLSAKLWLSVAWPLLALTWTTSFGFSSSSSLLIFTLFPLPELCKIKIYK